MTLFGVKDNFADTRAKYKDIFLFSTDSTIYNIPKKYIDTESTNSTHCNLVLSNQKRFFFFLKKCNLFFYLNSPIQTLSLRKGWVKVLK